MDGYNPLSDLSDLSDQSSSDNNKINFSDDDNNNDSGNNGRSYESDRSDTSSSSTTTTKNYEGLQNNMIKNENALNNSEIEVLKSEPVIGFREPFYYCKECPKVQNINHKEIKNHLLYSKVHKSP